jgi:DNA mismatch repair protein MutL
MKPYQTQNKNTNQNHTPKSMTSPPLSSGEGPYGTLSQSPIIKLDDITASKIAAGEVVEKPAMVVKELVENAIDAGSSKIIVSIEKGGKKKIAVTDNGRGIPRDDLKLVFERHATSKIKTLEDLYETASLGFRGEALASICAVSEVSLITMTDEDKIAAHVKARGGKLLDISEIGALKGTTMSVENLFFNTPARLKFLKSDQAEGKRITELMSHLALSHPEIAFHYTLEGKRVFQTPGDGQLANAIFEVFDREMIKNLFEVSHEALDIKLKGYASTFSYTKGNSTLQIVFVNGRYVKSPLVKEAIQLAYKPYLMQNRFPVCIFFLEISPKAIDVNIHPAKTEIKFHHEGDIKQLIYTALRKVFNLHNQIPSVKYTEKDVFRKKEADLQKSPLKTAEKNGVSSVIKEAPSSEYKGINPQVESGEVSLGETPSMWTKSAIKASNVLVESPKKEISPPLTQARRETPENPKRHDMIEESKERTERVEEVEQDKHEHISSNIQKSSLSNMKDDLVFSDKSSENLQESYTQDLKPYAQNKTPHVDFEQYDLSDLSDFADRVEVYDRPLVSESIYDGLRYIGSFINTYLIYEKEEKLYLIDQHAAHEKILYEQLMAAFRTGQVNTQLLLLPETIDYRWHHEGDLTGVITSLNQVGFDVDEFGEGTLVIRGIPDFISLQVAKKLLAEIFDGATDAVVTHLSETLMSKACKTAIKAHDVISHIEVEALLEGLKGLDAPYTCPHGRPIIIEMDKSYIEKRFKRIV